jgi:hypothetical protein
LLPDDYLVVSGANRFFRWMVRGMAPFIEGKGADV